MRKLFAALAFVFLSALGYGQTVTVTGHTITGQNGTSSSGISILWELTNDGGQQCKVAGTGLITPMSFSVTQAQLAAGMALFPNSAITCGTTTGATRWRYTVKSGGTGTRQCSLNITGTTNLDSTACLNATATPVTATPTDSIYCRIDGSNCGFTGAITGTAFNFSGNGIVGGTFSVVGGSTLAALSATQITNSGDTLLSSGKVVKWNADTGLSRDSAGVIDVGNGTQGDKSGTILLSKLGAGGANAGGSSAGDITAARSTTSGAVYLGSDGSGFLFRNGNTVTLQGTSLVWTFPATTDTLVGKATTDTLTNKTLNGAGSGNAVNLLNEQPSAGALTGNSSDQTIFTYTLPANTLGAGKGLKIKFWANHNSGTAAIVYKVFFGATVYANNTTAAAAGQAYFEINVFNNSGVVNAQHGSNFASYPTGTSAPFAPLTSAIDTTAPVIIKATFNVANTDQVTPGHWIVELVQ